MMFIRTILFVVTFAASSAFVAEANPISKLFAYIRQHPLRAAVKKLHKARAPWLAEQMQSTYTSGMSESEVNLFLGVSNEDVERIVVRTCEMVSPFDRFTPADVFHMMDSGFAEQRLMAVYFLQHRFSPTMNKLARQEKLENVELDEFSATHIREEIVAEFLRRIPTHLNNWNLVDQGVPPILGEYIADNPEKATLLHKLAKSQNVWERRAALMGTLPLAKLGQYNDLEALVLTLTHDPAYIVRRAAGLVLHDRASHNNVLLADFLKKNARKLSQETLLTAMGRLSPETHARFVAAVEKFPENFSY